MTFDLPTCVIRQFMLKRFRYAILQQKNEFVNFNGRIKSLIFKIRTFTYLKIG